MYAIITVVLTVDHYGLNEMVIYTFVVYINKSYSNLPIEVIYDLNVKGSGCISSQS